MNNSIWAGALVPATRDALSSWPTRPVADNLINRRLPDDLKELELTILFPCLNEAETIGTCVGKAMSYLAGSGVIGEVLVADNGSTDGSQGLAAAKGARVGSCARSRLWVGAPERNSAARGRYVVMGDADDSYDLSVWDFSWQSSGKDTTS